MSVPHMPPLVRWGNKAWIIWFSFWDFFWKNMSLIIVQKYLANICNNKYILAYILPIEKNSNKFYCINPTKKIICPRSGQKILTRMKMPALPRKIKWSLPNCKSKRKKEIILRSRKQSKMYVLIFLLSIHFVFKCWILLICIYMYGCILNI